MRIKRLVKKYSIDISNQKITIHRNIYSSKVLRLHFAAMDYVNVAASLYNNFVQQMAFYLRPSAASYHELQQKFLYLQWRSLYVHNP